jgi:hypothetical protein
MRTKKTAAKNTTTAGTSRAARPWDEMTVAELAQATRDLDKVRFDDTQPMTAAQRRNWTTSRRGPGRPRKPAAEKAARVLVTLKPQLLADADAYAAKQGVTRAELFARGLAAILPSKQRRRTN